MFRCSPIRAHPDTYHSACVLVLALLLLASTGCARSDATRPSAEVTGPITLTVGYPHQTGQDPLYGVQQAARLLSFEGLAYLTRDGRPRPRLAESWLESPDGLTWSIKLRPNARFHDGSPVDAAAVKESLDRSIAGRERAFRPGLSDILRVEAPSKTELVIRLSASSTFAIDDLTVSIVKNSNGTDVGTGPFVTTSTTPTEVVMTVVPNYYRAKPVIDRIVWRAYPAVRTAWAAMMRGDIDFLYEVAPDTIEFIETEESVGVFPFLRNYVYAIALNTKRRPFNSREVRRALNYAVDRHGIIELALKGKGKAANGPMWPQHWAFDSSIAEYAYDPSRATALLDAAGIPTIRTSAPGEAPARLHFTCLVPQNFALWERMALLAQRDFSHVGIDMQFESVTFDDFNKRLSIGDFDAAIMELVVGNSVSRPYFFWHSKGLLNAWGYNNPKVDAALDDIRRSSNEQIYRNAFRALQTETLDDPPAVFLALGEVARAVSKRFKVVAQPGTDIIATIPDWQIGDDLVRTTD
jgi:peptide/nickel transport system substrate-binding protein